RVRKLHQGRTIRDADRQTQVRETHLHRRTIRQVRRQSQIEERALKKSQRITLEHQQAFFDEPHVEAQKLLDRSEPVIRTHVNRRVLIDRVEQLAKSRINRVPVFVRAAYVCVVFLAIEERVTFVQQVPKLVLEAIGAPIVSRENVPRSEEH